MFLYVVSVILVIVSGCNGYESDDKGMLEKVTSEIFPTIEQFPSSVSIQKNFKHVCTGVILSRYYVLTAAHCFGDVTFVIKKKIPAVNKYYIVTGTRNISKPHLIGNYRRIDKVFIHNIYFTNNKSIDMAVIKIAGSINLNGSTRKAAQFASLSNSDETYKFKVAGWGLYDPNHKNENTSLVLRSAEFSARIAGSRHSMFLGRNMTPNVNVCEGDSGAGAFFQNKLIGILFDGDCNVTKKNELHSLYTSVLSNITESFINQILENKCPEKSSVIINKNLDWDPVLKTVDSLGTVTPASPPTIGLEHCKVL